MAKVFTDEEALGRRLNFGQRIHWAMRQEVVERVPGIGVFKIKTDELQLKLEKPYDRLGYEHYRMPVHNYHLCVRPTRYKSSPERVLNLLLVIRLRPSLILDHAGWSPLM